MKSEELKQLVEHLRTQPTETEWLEVKHNNDNPQEIGEYISALSNSAALLRRNQAFILWGVNNDTHELVGTSFCPRQKKIGNEELENWLAHQLTPRIDVQIHEGKVGDIPVVLFEIQPAIHQPVSFSGIEYIRVGSYKKRLKEHPEKERLLWALSTEKPFEECVAAPNVSANDVLSLVDYTTCFRLLNIPLPDNRQAILDRLMTEKVIVRHSSDRFDITNVGAILFAANLSRFTRLTHKAPRVIIYRGENRTDTIKEQKGGSLGYAIGFTGLVSYITDQLPQNEQIEKAIRRQVRIYPEIAIRELVANALIHQDLNMHGTRPMIEIFTDRMEISNPGLPLINTLRFIDEPPQSRNEILAGMMRRMSICEERGSGVDKVIFHVEAFQLPAPDFRTTTKHTVAVLYGPRDFSKMDRQDRIRACYQHACLWYVSGKQITNQTLRDRLKIEKTNYPMASRIIRDTIDAELIRPMTGSGKESGYVPFWA
ncbi:MAG: ATP-binding protein [Phycisphaerae bacterium]